MEIIIKEQNLTISKVVTPTIGDYVTAEDVLLAAYDIIGRVFSQEAVIRAYNKTDPDSMGLK
jgi:hypothetical protein